MHITFQCICGSLQPYFSHTILILHNTVWSRGIFQECNHSQWLGFAALPFKTMHLKYMLYSWAWCEDTLLLLYDMSLYLKKDFVFLFIKIAFPVLHHNIYIYIFVTLLYFQFWYTLLLTHKQPMKEGNCNILGLAGLQVFNKGNKDELKKTTYTYSNSV